MEDGQQQGEATSNGNGDQSQFFGEYEAIRSIGKGKFAVVYRAHKVGDDQNVALKRISVDMMNDKAREKCLKEVRLLQSLDHPNIIRYMDSFICNNDLIIVYEWAAAGDLKRQLRKAQERGVGFEERVIWKYFAQICNAMQHMHEKRIMHRDLKPANIFLTLEGVIKVGDLGLSRELSDNTFQAHSKVGTPLYMSPEVLKGDGYDFKSDIWSLGCLLYELAMLKSPFRSEGLNLVSLFQKISSGDYQPLPDTYSDELRNLTYAMMSTKPEDRPEIGSVCQIANRMRAQTANDKGNKKRPPSGNSQESGSGSTADQTVPTNNNEEEKHEDKKDDERLRSLSSVDVDKHKNKANDDLTRKSAVNKISIEREDLHVEPGNDRSADKKLVRKTSAERKSQNPFQRAPSNSNILIDETKSESAHRVRDGFEDEDKAVQGGLTLGDYFLQQEHEQKRAPSKEDVWKSSMPKPSHVSNDVGSNKSSVAFAETEEGNNSRPNSSRPISGAYNAKVAPNQLDPEFNTANAMYRRAKPPRGPSEANAAGNTSYGPPTTRVNTAEAVSSRPTSGVFSSRPSTVDDNPIYNNATNEATNPKLKEALDNASAAFALMDLTYGKLQLLGYPMAEPGVTQDRSGRGRLLPFHFAINTNAYQTIAGCNTGYQFVPFKRLLHVILWLCENKLTPSNSGLQKIIKGIDRETGTNMTIAKQLLQAAQAIGEGSEELNAITPSSIIPGFGYNTVVLLTHFADCSLKAINFVANPTVHAVELESSQDGDENDSMDEDDSIVAENEEENEEENDEIVSSQMSISMGRSRFHVSDFGGHKIDPTLWKQETERVSGLLKKSEQVMTISNTSSWRFHLELIAKYCSAHLDYLKTQLESAQTTKPQEVIDPMERPLGKQASQTTVPLISVSGHPLCESISRLKSLLQSEIQNISQKERYLNNQPEMSKYSREYATNKQECIMLEENGNRANQSITVLASTLAVLEDQLEDVQKMLNQKISGDSDGGTNIIVKMKEAILQLQKEIHEMHMNCVISNEELIGRQKAQLYYLHHKRKMQEKHRRKSNTEDDAASV